MSHHPQNPESSQLDPPNLAPKTPPNSLPQNMHSARNKLAREKANVPFSIENGVKSWIEQTFAWSFGHLRMTTFG
jgi:hypothetical protein